MNPSETAKEKLVNWLKTLPVERKDDLDYDISTYSVMPTYLVAAAFSAAGPGIIERLERRYGITLTGEQRSKASQFYDFFKAYVSQGWLYSS